MENQSNESFVQHPVYNQEQYAQPSGEQNQQVNYGSIDQSSQGVYNQQQPSADSYGMQYQYQQQAPQQYQFPQYQYDANQVQQYANTQYQSQAYPQQQGQQAFQYNAANPQVIQQQQNVAQEFQNPPSMQTGQTQYAYQDQQQFQQQQQGQQQQNQSQQQEQQQQQQQSYYSNQQYYANQPQYTEYQHGYQMAGNSAQVGYTGNMQYQYTTGYEGYQQVPTPGPPPPPPRKAQAGTESQPQTGAQALQQTPAQGGTVSNQPSAAGVTAGGAGQGTMGTGDVSYDAYMGMSAEEQASYVQAQWESWQAYYQGYAQDPMQSYYGQQYAYGAYGAGQQFPAYSQPDYSQSQAAMSSYPTMPAAAVSAQGAMLTPGAAAAAMPALSLSAAQGAVMPGGAPATARKAIPDWLRAEMAKRGIAQGGGKGSEEDSEGPARSGSGAGMKTRNSMEGPRVGGGGAMRRRGSESGSEEEDEEEQRRLAINSEIKRQLTNMLLEVTDALFEEVAAQVYSETAPVRGSAGQGSVRLAQPAVKAGTSSRDSGLVATNNGNSDGGAVKGSGLLGLGYQSDEEEAEDDSSESEDGDGKDTKNRESLKVKEEGAGGEGKGVPGVHRVKEESEPDKGGKVERPADEGGGSIASTTQPEGPPLSKGAMVWISRDDGERKLGKVISALGRDESGKLNYSIIVEGKMQRVTQAQLTLLDLGISYEPAAVIQKESKYPAKSPVFSPKKADLDLKEESLAERAEPSMKRENGEQASLPSYTAAPPPSTYSTGRDTTAGDRSDVDNRQPPASPEDIDGSEDSGTSDSPQRQDMGDKGGVARDEEMEKAEESGDSQRREEKSGTEDLEASEKLELNKRAGDKEDEKQGNKEEEVAKEASKKERSKDKKHDKGKDSKRTSDKEGSGSKKKEKDKKKEKSKEKKREKDREKEESSDREDERERNKRRSREEEKEKERIKQKEREREREKEREKERAKEKERQRDKEREREREKDREREKEREREREKEREKDRERQRGRERERAVKERGRGRHESRERSLSHSRSRSPSRSRDAKRKKSSPRHHRRSPSRERPRSRSGSRSRRRRVSSRSPSPAKRKRSVSRGRKPQKERKRSSSPSRSLSQGPSKSDS